MSNHTTTHKHTQGKNLKTHIHKYTEKKITVSKIRKHSNTHTDQKLESEIKNHSNTHTHAHTQRIKYQKQMRGKVDKRKHILRKREEWTL